MPRQPFEKVSAGPGVVYDTEYNAFLDVARRARGGQDVDVTKIAKGVVLPCVNRTEFDFKAFDVVTIESPIVTPEVDPNEFKYKTPVVTIGTHDNGAWGRQPLPSWGVLQSAAASGDSSRVMVSGITAVVVEPTISVDYAEDDDTVSAEQRGKKIFFQGPYGVVVGRTVGPFVVGQCEILYQEPFTQEKKHDEIPISGDPGITVLGMIRFPTIHHELVRAKAMESMRYDPDRFYRSEVYWQNTAYEFNLTSHDWLNVTINQGDNIHLGFFPDRQRLSVITCCSAPGGDTRGFGCACLNDICRITLGFENVGTNGDFVDACDNCSRWNFRDYPLYPPTADPAACTFRAQQTGNPENRSWNSNENFPCYEEGDGFTYLELQLSCLTEDDTQATLDVHTYGRRIITAIWEDRQFEGALSAPDQVYVYPLDIPGVSTEASDAQINRNANNVGGGFDPDTSSPNLKDNDAGGVGVGQCDNYLVAPSGANPEEPRPWDFGSGGVERIVDLQENDRVVYDGGVWHVIKNVGGAAAAEDGPYVACELDSLTDPKGCDWTTTAQTPNMNLTFERCES